MARCPAVQIGWQAGRFDDSIVDVWVHCKHDDISDDELAAAGFEMAGEHGCTMVALDVVGAEAAPEPRGRNDARAELSGDDVVRLTGHLRQALARAGQLVPDHPAVAGNTSEPVAMMLTSHGDSIAVSVRLGHERAGEGHKLTFITLTVWRDRRKLRPCTGPADGAAVMMFPDEARELIATLQRARERADPAAADRTGQPTGCPVKKIGVQYSRCDRSTIKVTVHRAHGDVREDGHDRSTVNLDMLAPDSSGRPGAFAHASGAKLSGAEVQELELALLRALERAGQLAPGHLQGRPQAREADYFEHIAMIQTSVDDRIGVAVHYGHEGDADRDHELTYIRVSVWQALTGLGIFVMLFPGDVRGLLSMLERARGRAAASR